MKRKILLNLAFLVILAFSILPTGVFASTDNSNNIAQQAAQDFIKRIGSTNAEFSKWQTSTVTSPQPYQDVNGSVNSIMFAISDPKGIIGHVLVGSSQYNYDIFEAGGSVPPVIPTLNQIKEAIAPLKLTPSESATNQPLRFIYTGVGEFYALYNYQNTEVAINLESHKAVVTSDLKITLPDPKSYAQNKSNTSNSTASPLLSGSGFKWLTMYAYTGGWCGPCSGVSIGAYYRDIKGYTALFTNSVMYQYLYYSMGTSVNGGATMPYDYGPGFIAMTHACGYYNFSYVTDYVVTGSDYVPTVVNSINSNWPIALCVTSDWHWRAIRGYYYFDPNNHYIYCTDSATGQDALVMNWDSLGLGLFTVVIKN